MTIRLKNFWLVAVAALMCMAMQTSAVAQDSMSMGNKNIVETAMADARFSMLVKALKKADLVETLKGAGPFTVFAPTDDAFAKVPADKLKMLMNDKAMLKSVLLYHVMSGKVMASDARTMMAPMMEGTSASVTVGNGMVMVDNARVVQADIMTSNGVIHAIDTVLMPKMGMSSAMGENMGSMSNMDIVDMAMSNPNFSMLVELVKTAGLVDTLKSAGPFTVFAPTNAAFAKVSPAKLEMLKNNPEMLKQVLLYHVLSMKVPSSNARTMEAMTVQGSNAKVKVKMKDGMTVVMVDKARVTQPDMMASNGVIHGIDTVLMPKNAMKRK